MVYQRIFVDNPDLAYTRFNWMNLRGEQEKKGKLFEFRVELFKAYCAIRNAKEAAQKIIRSEELRKSLIRYEDRRYEEMELLGTLDDEISLYNMTDLEDKDMAALSQDYEEYCKLVEINMICGEDIVILRKFKRVFLENSMDEDLDRKLKHLTPENMEDVFEELSIPMRELKEIAKGRPYSFYVRLM